jgi:selenocysteine lyase/cysteine desulfurase
MRTYEARRLYPYLNNGKIYLNHAACSPLSVPVVEAVHRYAKERSETNIENFPLFQDVYLRTKEKIGRMINASSDRISFSDNTSNALNIPARGFRWQKGDRILLNDIEFPSNVYPFLNLRNEGVEIDFVKSVNGQVTVEAIEAALTPSTKMLSISHVQFLSGYRADLEKIGALCRERGIIFIVDAIQSAGAIGIDVKKCNIDFLAAGTQKWLMALEGLSVIYITEELQEKISQHYAGWLSVDDTWNLLDYNLVYKQTAERYHNGTLNNIGIYALDASLGLFEEIGYQNIEESILNNSEYLINKLNEADFKPVLTDADRKNLSGIVSLRPDDANNLYEFLMQNNIETATREGILRIAPHYYNTREELDKVISALKKYR